MIAQRNYSNHFAEGLLLAAKRAFLRIRNIHRPDFALAMKWQAASDARQPDAAYRSTLPPAELLKLCMRR